MECRYNKKNIDIYRGSPPYITKNWYYQNNKGLVRLLGWDEKASNFSIFSTISDDSLLTYKYNLYFSFPNCQNTKKNIKFPRNRPLYLIKKNKKNKIIGYHSNIYIYIYIYIYSILHI